MNSIPIEKSVFRILCDGQAPIFWGAGSPFYPALATLLSWYVSIKELKSIFIKCAWLDSILYFNAWYSVVLSLSGSVLEVKSMNHTKWTNKWGFSVFGVTHKAELWPEDWWPIRATPHQFFQTVFLEKLAIAEKTSMLLDVVFKLLEKAINCFGLDFPLMKRQQTKWLHWATSV